MANPDRLLISYVGLLLSCSGAIAIQLGQFSPEYDLIVGIATLVVCLPLALLYLEAGDVP